MDTLEAKIRQLQYKVDPGISVHVALNLQAKLTNDILRDVPKPIAYRIYLTPFHALKEES